jgi:hypothetical protein
MRHRGLTGHFGQPRADGVKGRHNAALTPPERRKSKRRELVLEIAQIMATKRQILRKIDRSRQKTPPRHLGGPVVHNGLALLNDGSSDANHPR